jgi:hypothetical protein
MTQPVPVPNDYPTVINGQPLDADAWFNRIAQDVTVLKGASVTSKTATTTVTNRTDEVIIHTLTIAGGSSKQGSVYKLGVFGTGDIVGTPTLTLRARVGGIVGSVFGTIGITGVANTFRPWTLDFKLICMTTGATGAMSGVLVMTSRIPGATAPDNASTSMDGPASPQTIDTTIGQDVVITAQWSVASTSNTLRADAGEAYRIVAQ